MRNCTINSTSGATLPVGRFAGQCLRHSGNSQRLTSRSIPGTDTLQLGVLLAKVVSPVGLGLIYFLAIVPTGLIIPLAVR